MTNRHAHGPRGKIELRRLSDVIDNPRFVDALHNAGLDDCGDLKDHINKTGTWWGRKVKGVGEVAQTKIEDAFNLYAAEHPEAAE